jgi:endonuclease/exonuclease/phosphatase family metal-dependent hydrolase
VDNFSRVLDAINLVNPDICCINEALHPFKAPSGPEGLEYYQAAKDGNGKGLILPPDHKPEGLDDTYLSTLARETGLCNFEYGIADETESSFGAVPFGNAILSRFPIRSCTHVSLDVEEGDVELGYQKRCFVDPRQAILATIELEGADVVDSRDNEMSLGIVTMHLDQISEELRGKQTSKVVDAANNILPLGFPRIIAGDFNSFRKSPDMNDDRWKVLSELYASRGWGEPNRESLVLNALEDDGYADTFSFEEGQYPQPTCWTKIPVMRIDHILMKSPPTIERGYDIKALSHNRVDVEDSDHFPIYVDFEVVQKLQG